jgi:DNA-binding NtrC family response regulator
MVDMRITATNGQETVPASAAVDALYHGAANCLTKPCNASERLLKVRPTPESRQNDRELKLLREELRSTYSFDSIVTRSEKMKDLIRQVQQVADTEVTVLIQGESGTGKELIAHALHFSGMRAAGPFIAVNCSAIPENLLESELFGHEKGSFTGATKQKHGRFEDAHTGTLFLDEIGDISSTVQAKLLRVLQEKKFERVGSNSPVTVDTRVVVATNRNLELMMHEGDFREDLFYRLNVYPITLPPLRDRLEDVPLLAEHFIQRNADLSNARVKYIAPGVISDMMNYSWRGNIRELENLIKRAIIKTSGDTITSLELPASTGVPSPSTTPDILQTVNLNTPFKHYLSTIVHDAEEKYLLRMLRLYKGNINHIAKLMDLDRKTVYSKMKEYSIDPSSFRAMTA